MADPTNQTIPSPQNLVDEALKDAPTVSPVETPAAPAAPVAPVTPPATPPLTSVTATAPAEPVMSSLPPLPSAATTTTTTTTTTPIAPSSTSVPMGDDTPLAFAPTPPISTTTITQPLVPPVEQSSYLPPVPPVPVEDKPKKKSKAGLMVAGLLLLLVALGGGVYGYMQFNAGSKQVALASPSPSASATIPQIAKLTEDTGKAIVKQTVAEEKKGAGRVESKTREGVEVYVPVGALAGANQIADMLNLQVDGKYVNTDPASIEAQAKKIGEEQAAIFNAGSKVGEPCDSDASTGSCAGGTSTCSGGICGGLQTGQCLPGDNCPISCNDPNAPAGATHPTTEPGGGAYCDSNGRQCRRYRREMMTTSSPGETTKWCFVGYGVDCGAPGSCGGDTTTTPSTPPTAPTMACTGITSVPATTTAPAVGTKLTFTCAGTVTPADAGTLSYKFRYSINGGATTALTNKTATTAELTIAACGTYSVQCQACATLSGVLTCNPTWTGATQ